MKERTKITFKKGAKECLSAICFLMCFGVAKVNGQSEIETIISQVSRNNKTLQSQSKYWEARKIEFKTANNLYDPTISIDHMQGTPYIRAGNETDINVVQRFDFPTVYGKRKQMAAEQGRQSEYLLINERQNILLETITICIELVYRSKLQQQVSERKAKTEKYLSDFQTKLNKGEGNILDVNKTRLLLIEINKEQQLNLSVVNQLNQQLTSLNGGNEIVFNGSDYPLAEALPDFELLVAQIENNDPMRKTLEQQRAISQKQIEVTRALALPRLDVGYHQQRNVGGNLYGAKIGMNIPIWENKNHVRQRQMELSTVVLQLEGYKNDFFYATRQLYEAYFNLEKTLEEYQTVLSSLNSVALLDKALELGEISTIEYFLETNYYYEATQNYLFTEKEYHQKIAELNKFKL